MRKSKFLSIILILICAVTAAVVSGCNKEVVKLEYELPSVRQVNFNATYTPVFVLGKNTAIESVSVFDPNKLNIAQTANYGFEAKQYGAYTYNVVFAAGDLRKTETFLVNVVDISAPVITKLPEDKTGVEAGLYLFDEDLKELEFTDDNLNMLDSVVKNITAIAFDGNTVAQSEGGISQYEFNKVGEFTITAKVTDFSGLSASGTYKITVQDSIAPVLEDMSNAYSWLEGGKILLGEPNVYDACGVKSIVNTVAGKEIVEGKVAATDGETITVSFTAEDNNGNISSGEYKVTAKSKGYVSDFSNADDIKLWNAGDRTFIRHSAANNELIAASNTGKGYIEFSKSLINKDFSKLSSVYFTLSNYKASKVLCAVQLISDGKVYTIGTVEAEKAAANIDGKVPAPSSKKAYRCSIGGVKIDYKKIDGLRFAFSSDSKEFEAAIGKVELSDALGDISLDGVTDNQTLTTAESFLLKSLTKSANSAGWSSYVSVYEGTELETATLIADKLSENTYYTFPKAGSFIVKWSASDFNGNAVFHTRKVTVTKSCDVNFDDAALYGIAGEKYTLPKITLSESNYTASVLCFNEEGTSQTIVNGAFTPETEGRYRIEYTVTGGGNTKTINKDIFIKSKNTFLSFDEGFENGGKAYKNGFDINYDNKYVVDGFQSAKYNIEGKGLSGTVWNNPLTASLNGNVLSINLYAINGGAVSFNLGFGTGANERVFTSSSFFAYEGWNYFEIPLTHYAAKYDFAVNGLSQFILANDSDYANTFYVDKVSLENKTQFDKEALIIPEATMFSNEYGRLFITPSPFINDGLVKDVTITYKKQGSATAKNAKLHGSIDFGTKAADRGVYIFTYAFKDLMGNSFIAEYKVVAEKNLIYAEIPLSNLSTEIDINFVDATVSSSVLTAAELNAVTQTKYWRLTGTDKYNKWDGKALVFKDITSIDVLYVISTNSLTNPKTIYLEKTFSIRRAYTIFDGEVYDEGAHYLVGDLYDPRTAEWISVDSARAYNGQFSLKIATNPISSMWIGYDYSKIGAIPMKNHTGLEMWIYCDYEQRGKVNNIWMDDGAGGVYASIEKFMPGWNKYIIKTDKAFSKVNKFCIETLPSSRGLYFDDIIGIYYPSLDESSFNVPSEVTIGKEMSLSPVVGGNAYTIEQVTKGTTIKVVNLKDYSESILKLSDGAYRHTFANTGKYKLIYDLTIDGKNIWTKEYQIEAVKIPMIINFENECLDSKGVNVLPKVYNDLGEAYSDDKISIRFRKKGAESFTAVSNYTITINSGGEYEIEYTCTSEGESRVISIIKRARDKSTFADFEINSDGKHDGHDMSYNASVFNHGEFSDEFASDGKYSYKFDLAKDYGWAGFKWSKGVEFDNKINTITFMLKSSESLKMATGIYSGSTWIDATTIDIIGDNAWHLYTVKLNSEVDLISQFAYMASGPSSVIYFDTISAFKA